MHINTVSLLPVLGKKSGNYLSRTHSGREHASTVLDDVGAGNPNVGVSGGIPTAWSSPSSVGNMIGGMEVVNHLSASGGIARNTDCKGPTSNGGGPSSSSGCDGEAIFDGDDCVLRRGTRRGDGDVDSGGIGFVR
nr:hypothetical protein Iba_chr05fCG7940 [Ipomoea batatas]